MHALVKLVGALANETRLRILQGLVEGEATVSDLGARLGLAQPRISTHLKILLEVGLVVVETEGRQRTYRVNAKRIAQVFATLRALVPAVSALSPPSPQAMREVRRNTPVRQARTCYDHLAGVAGVQLLDELLRRNWVTTSQGSGRPQYELTPAGVRGLTKRNVDLDSARSARRAFAYPCPDWTERRPHLGGALGAAVFRALREAGTIQRRARSRAVTLLKSVSDWFDESPRAGSV